MTVQFSPAVPIHPGLGTYIVYPYNPWRGLMLGNTPIVFDDFVYGPYVDHAERNLRRLLLSAYGF
jgi:hypothetical protein